MGGRGGTAAADGKAESGGAGGLFRPDVEGLRGVAILLVLLFHGALPVPGGFVGVDVFLVISGYLITGLLVRELETSGRIDLPAFYGRRLRRLLPAAAMMIAVVLPVAYVALPPLDRSDVMADGAAAVLCASNLRSALAAGDYFTAIASPSPFLHFWSLSLEEQFYLVWPLLLLLVARGGRARLAAGTALVVLACASLAASVVLTDAVATWGYYSLPSRAWQFAAGGLIAAGAGPLRRLPARPVAAAGWLGAAALVAAALVIDGTIPYPGLVALLPTFAAVALIVAGDRSGGPGVLLRVAPLRFLGRISYSLYLWHWPLLVLPVAATGVALDLPQTSGLLALAVVVAWGSWALIEEPFRKAHGARRTLTRLSLQLGSATIVGVVAWSGMLGVSADAAIAGISTGPRADVTAREDEGPASLGSVASVTPSPAGDAGESAPSDDGTTARADLTAGPRDPGPPTAAASDTIAARGSPGAWSSASSAPSSSAPAIAWSSIPDRRLPGGVRLPADVLPALGDARYDRERLADDGCFTWLEGTKPAECVYGDKHGAVTIVLIGDSHAGHWFPAFNVLARRHGWRLIPLVKASCPFVDMAVLHPFAKREYTECATWRQRAIRAANAAQPDLVVVASAYRGIRATTPAQDGAKAEGQAMARAIGRLSAPVAVIVDNPRTGTDIPACLSRHTADVNACAIPRSEALGPSFGTRERIAAQLGGAALVDVIPEVCPSMPCPVVRDGMILYRDGHHLTATFVRSLAPAFDAALRPLLTLPAPSATVP